MKKFSILALLIAVVFFGFVFSGPTKSVPEFWSDARYTPEHLKLFSYKEGLSAFHDSTISVYQVNPKKFADLPVRLFNHSSSLKPTLFVLARTPSSMTSRYKARSFIDTEHDKGSNNVYLGYRSIQSFVSRNANSNKYNYIYLNVSATRNGFRDDPTLIKELYAYNNHISESYYGVPELSREVKTELNNLITEQDKIFGSNGYNPQHFAVLAYYPATDRYAIIDDSKFMTQIRIDFELADANGYSNNAVDSYYKDGLFLRSKFKSIPDKVIGKVDYKEKSRKLLKFLKSDVEPLSKKALKQASDLLRM